MTDNPLESLTNYSRFVAELLHRLPVERSTVVVWSASGLQRVHQCQQLLALGWLPGMAQPTSYSRLDKTLTGVTVVTTVLPRSSIS